MIREPMRLGKSFHALGWLQAVGTDAISRLVSDRDIRPGPWGIV